MVTEMVAMTATTMTMETKATAVTAAVAASLTAEAAAWQKRDFGGSGSALGSIVTA